MKNNSTLTIGETYDISTLTFTGWTVGNGSSTQGYNVADYFRNGVYLGVDDNGIEPIVSEISGK